MNENNKEEPKKMAEIIKTKEKLVEELKSLGITEEGRNFINEDQNL